MTTNFNPYLQFFFEGTIIPTFDLQQLLCIDYKPYYNLSKGSLGQIITAISLIKIKKNEKNEYEKILDRWFNTAIPLFINKFIELFNNYQTTTEYEVKWYNLAGNLPKSVVINSEKHNKKLSKANIGNLHEALIQRIDFIIERDMPEPYKGNNELESYFNNLREQIKLFRNEANMFNESFVKIIDLACKTQKKWYANQRENKIQLADFINQ